MQCVIDIDETLAARLGALVGDAPPGEGRARLGALLDLALSRVDEASRLGLLEGRAEALLGELGARLEAVEALADRVLFFAVASYALARAPADPAEARRIFQTSYEGAREEIERRCGRVAGGCCPRRSSVGPSVSATTFSARNASPGPRDPRVSGAGVARSSSASRAARSWGGTSSDSSAIPAGKRAGGGDRGGGSGVST